MKTEPIATQVPRFGGRDEAKLPPRLEDARRRFDRWRATREKVGPIPEELWNEAASCAGQYGAYRTARALGLDSAKLKRWGERRKKGGKKRVSPSRPTFVEVRAPTPAAPSAECVLELESRAGTRLRIQLRDAPLAQVAELVRSLTREGV